MGLRVGIDVGGTFTDFALYDEASGLLRIGKVLTTPADPSEGVLAGLDGLLDEAGAAAADLRRAVHATTIATNTVIERKGPPTALLTTAGFRDVLLVGRQKRWELYDNTADRPMPVVRRRHIWEARERLLHDGTVHVPLDEDDVRRAAAAMAAAGIRAVAVCFLHSYVDPAHERRAGEILREAAPDLMVTLSSEVAPMYREYERSNTTTLNAYVMPAVTRYVARLEDGLAGRGCGGPLFVMQSNGGVATPDVIGRTPIRIIESGPAAGVLTAARYAGPLGLDRILSFDMGGTTAKVCLIEDGRPLIASQFEVDMVNLKKSSGLPISTPAIDLVEIGSGGGSIARVATGAIAVGPDSAGSDPGPVCYGRGGDAPTVTDADLLLGYLDPGYFLGGRMALDVEAARRAVADRVARPLGIDVVEAAWGIHEVVTAQMAHAARVITVERGKDPRRFALFPFGGAGPVHGARLARMLGCHRVVFPSAAGVQSAVGLLMADPAFDLMRTRITLVAPESSATVDAIFAELEAAGAERLAACGIAEGIRLERRAEMRFVGQGYEIQVTLPGDGAADPEAMRAAFFDAYAATYGDRTFDRAGAVEIVHFHVRAVGTAGLPVTAIRVGDAAERPAALKGTRPVYFPETGGFVPCPVYARDGLADGMAIDGPAIVEERESTIVLVPDCRATVDRLGNIVVDLGTGEPA